MKLLLFAEGLEDGVIDIVIEMGIGFHALFGIVVIGNETHAPFEGFVRVIMLDVVCLAASESHEGTVPLASVRPVFWEMVSIEFVQSRMMARGAYDNACAAFLSGLNGVKCADDGNDEWIRDKVLRTSCRAKGGGSGDDRTNMGFYSPQNACFFMYCHVFVSCLFCASYE